MWNSWRQSAWHWEGSGDWLTHWHSWRLWECGLIGDANINVNFLDKSFGYIFWAVYLFYSALKVLFSSHFKLDSIRHKSFLCVSFCDDPFPAQEITPKWSIINVKRSNCLSFCWLKVGVTVLLSVSTSVFLLTDSGPRSVSSQSTCRLIFSQHGGLQISLHHNAGQETTCRGAQ